MRFGGQTRVRVATRPQILNLLVLQFHQLDQVFYTSSIHDMLCEMQF
jgi:hypothetical protein